jgi:hypothetical protein
MFTLSKHRIFILILLFGIIGMSSAQIETFITADDGAENDQFGNEIALSQDYLVCGAPYDDNANGTDAGAVYIYKREVNQWIFDTKVLASDGANEAYFGYSVDIDGDYIVVGSPWDDEGGEKVGAVYVFRLEGGNWIEKAKLKADDGTEDDRMGISVKIYETTVAAGAFFDDVVGNRSGSAYIFVLEGSNWLQQAKLLPSDGAEEDWFGTVLSLYNNDVAITSRKHDGPATNSGAVYVFGRSGGTWTENAKLTHPDAEIDDEFGTPCIFGNTLIVGCYGDDDAGFNAGAIFYYQRINNVWMLQAKITASDGNSGDWFGSNVSLTPTHMVVSAYRDDMIGENAGSAYIFEREDFSYREIAKLTASNGYNGDYFGLKNGLSGDYVAVGARNRDDKGNNAGGAYVYHMVEDPEIVSVKDVPYDQGGYVEIKWNASYYDLGRNLAYYSIWRSMENPAPSASVAGSPKYRTISENNEIQTWGWVANVPGHRLEEYVYIAPTPFDSIAATDGIHYYLVSAHQKNEDIFFDSNVMIGYSVDNLSPPPPSGLVASLEGNQVELSWDALQVSDFSHFVIYRNDEMLISTVDNSYTDSNLEVNQTYVYQIQALDVHGNASELSDEASVMTTDVALSDGNKPETFELFHNHPNPFNPETSIQYQVPEASHVRILVYNIYGQVIRVLVDEEKAVGYFSVKWNGMNDLGSSTASGVYFYRMEARAGGNNYSQTRKMIKLN